MTSPPPPVPDTVEALRAALTEAQAQAAEARAEAALAKARAAGAEAMVDHLKLQIAKLRRERYGQRSERGRQVLEQLELQLEELEATAAEEEVATAAQAAQPATEVETEVKGHTRKRPVRAPLPAHLPRERRVLPSPSSCPDCGGKLTKLGEDVTETLEVIPRQYKVIQTVREKFSCRSCEKIHQPPTPFHRKRSGMDTLILIFLAQRMAGDFAS